MLWIHATKPRIFGIQYGASTALYVAPAPRLDTVDQAERTATFMAAEKQNTASTKAATRLSAMAKNLGPDSEGEDEEVGLKPRGAGGGWCMTIWWLVGGDLGLGWRWGWGCWKLRGNEGSDMSRYCYFSCAGKLRSDKWNDDL